MPPINIKRWKSNKYRLLTSTLIRDNVMNLRKITYLPCSKQNKTYYEFAFIAN